MKLPNGLTKFRSISIKTYFSNSIFLHSHKLKPNNSTYTQVSQTKLPLANTSLAEIPLVERLLSSLTFVQRSCKQSRNHYKQVNILKASDICFLRNKLDILNKNIVVQPAQYTACKQKKIAGLFEKSVSKVFTITSSMNFDLPLSRQGKKRRH